MAAIAGVSASMGSSCDVFRRHDTNISSMIEVWAYVPGWEVSRTSFWDLFNFVS